MWRATGSWRQYRTLACQQNRGWARSLGPAIGPPQNTKRHREGNRMLAPQVRHNPLEDPRKLLHPVHFLIRMSTCWSSWASTHCEAEA